MGLDGVLVVDKPAGLTSADVVARVKRALGGVKIGHTGTLDPMATGVLPLCLGEATKLAGLLTADDKAYDGELELGVETDTLDAEGKVVRERRAEAAAVDEPALAAAVRGFLGAQQQVPPMYSAIKQGGVRLHELARAGAEVARAPRAVRIDRFDLTSVALPRARFAVACSKGTYVRSLVADLGERLGCGAHLTALRRTRSGAFAIEQAIALAEIDPARAGAALIDLTAATADLPGARLAPAAALAVTHGKSLQWQTISPDPAPAGRARLLSPDGALLALIRVEGGAIVYDRVMRLGLT
jgi:tRNA pseudouridine55 synthase